MCHKIWKWSVLIQPTNPLENINTKDIKNRIFFMDFPSYKTRNSQYELTKKPLTAWKKFLQKKNIYPVSCEDSVLSKNAVIQKS